MHSIIDGRAKTSTFEFKAHAAEITDIAVFEGPRQYVACAARDRTVQIFTKSGDWSLLQTLDEHVGAVTGILFSRSGTRLVSCSSDRTIVVRELVCRDEDGETMSAFVILRTITLKATPVSMVWEADQDDVLVVSTIDRHVHKFDIRNGQSLSTFRASDTEGGDAVVLSSLVHISRTQGAPLIAGVSSTDKSIRLYEENSTLLARDWGHTEGVTDIALVESGSDEGADLKSLVTVAVDGTIFIWSLDMRQRHRQNQDLSKSMDLLGPDTPTNKDSLASKPPLRRVFSQSELARFQRVPDDETAPSTATATPTMTRSPRLRKRLSKFSLAQAPKLEPSPLPSTATGSSGRARRGVRNRSPSPPSPRQPQPSKRRSSVDVRPSRAKAASTNEFGTLGASTDSLCRTLRAYRKRLANTSDNIGSESVRDVERELAMTARAVGEKAKSKSVDETTMVRLLDQYSERLVNLLDEKIARSVEARMRENSQSDILASPGAASNPETPADHDKQLRSATSSSSNVGEETRKPRASASREPGK